MYRVSFILAESDVVISISLRQVKLADVLGKFIIPVSFLDHWPPKCLAIQFATTQYIDWKSQAQITAGESVEFGKVLVDPMTRSIHIINVHFACAFF